MEHYEMFGMRGCIDEGFLTDRTKVDSIPIPGVDLHVGNETCFNFESSLITNGTFKGTSRSM